MKQAHYLSFCRNELKRSKRWRSSTGYEYDDAWRRFVDLYHGYHYDKKAKTDRVTVNMVFSTINIMGPAVAINNPRFVVNARKPEEAANAVVTEEVLNYLWRTHDYQRDFRLAVHDWLIMGHGWLKAGYTFRKPPETKTADVGGRGPNASGNEGADEGIDDREPVEGNVESEMISKEDRPFVERITPFDMYVDPDARHPKEMRWIAQRTWRAVQDVAVDQRYSPTNRKRVSASHWSRWSDDDKGDARQGGEGNFVAAQPDAGAIGYCEVIEFYDIKRNKVSTFVADGSGETSMSGFLIKPDTMPYGLGHPYVMLRNYEIPDHFYPIGDVQQLETLQLELNETRNQMLNYRKKFRRAWTYDKDKFDQDGVRALQSEEDNVMIPVRGGEDPATALAPVPAPMTPPEFFDQSELIQNDMDQVSGVSDYHRGAPQQNIKRTATEAAMIQDAANARAQDRLMKVEGILAEVGERVIGLMQQYMTGQQVARLVNLPAQAWLNYDEEYIQGQFDYEVRGGSTEPRNETFRRQSAMQLVDASMPFLEMGVANPLPLYQKILTDGFGEKDPGRYVQQPPPPMPPEQGGMPPEQEGMPPPGMEGMPPPGMEGPPPEQGGMPLGMESQVPMSPEQAAMMGGGGAPMELTPEMLQMMMAEGQPLPPDIPPELVALLEAQAMGGQGGVPPGF